VTTISRNNIKGHCPAGKVVYASHQLGYEEWEQAWVELPPELREPYYHPAYALSDCTRYKGVSACCLITETDKHRVLYPFLLRPIGDTGLFDLASPYGYGGASATPVSTATLPTLATALDAVFGKNAVSAFTCYSPLLQNHLLGVGDEVSVYRRSRTYSLDLANLESESDLISRLAHKTHRKIRKALSSGLISRVDPLEATSYLTDFIRIYEATMCRVNALESYHFPATYYEGLRSVPNTHLLSITTDTGQYIAGCLMLVGGTTVHYHLAATDFNYQHVRPSDFLSSQVAAWGLSQGLQRVHWGGGVRQGDTLEYFKAQYSTAVHDFYTGHLVCNRAAYPSLSANVGSTEYFPAYRTLTQYKLHLT
jgi:hypothetical protein